jgi:sec-independent protein translocase protein TatB
VFDVGLLEFAIIALVAVFVFGPDKLPDLARQAARIARQVRRVALNARDELRAELGPEYSDLELRDLDPRQIVRRHLAEALDEEDDEDADEERPKRRGLRPLAAGEVPPYDSDAT